MIMFIIEEKIPSLTINCLKVPDPFCGIFYSYYNNQPLKIKRINILMILYIKLLFI